MICKESNGQTFKCSMYGHTCGCSDQFRGKAHVIKRRTLKRRERSQWKREVRDNF